MDLHLLPLVRRDGQDQAELPGLYIAPPPRRSARGRQSDRLILYLSMEGNAPLEGDQLQKLLVSLAESYYKTPASVTAAMRTVIENLNQFLLDRNLRNASSGHQGVGLLTILTQREERLYLAQCGPVHAYLLAAEGLRHILDPQPARRGLGLGRTAPIFYSQAGLSANDVLLISHQPPSAWNESTLAGLGGQGLESLRRRLMPLAGDELASVLILARPGPGKTFLLKPRPLTMEEAAAPTPTPVVESMPAPLPSQESSPPAMEAPPVVPEVQPVADAIPPQENYAAPSAPSAPAAYTAPPPSPTPAAPVASAAYTAPGVPSFTGAPAPQRAPQPAAIPEAEPAPQVPRERRRRRSSPFAPAAVALGGASQRISQAMGKLFQRMLPGEGTSLPGPIMMLMAVAVPLVVVTIASVIYFQRGRTGQQESYLAQAIQAAGAAQAQTDPLQAEQAWLAVLENAADAEKYQVSQQSQALRSQAVQAVDGLNLAVRLDFQPAITEGLPTQSQITRLLATPTDLYLLDSTTGGAYRAIFAGRGYDIDKTFQCGPGFQSSQGIGPLVDMQLYAKPDGSGTALLGMDNSGGLLVCSPGAPPEYIVMAPPPAGWANPVALAIYLGDAYVLDPGTKQIWVYLDSNFTAQADLFFDQNIPPLEDTIDLAVDQQDLYLLHSDGHLTQCTVSGFGVSATQCTDPAVYQDARPGREGQALTPAAAFIEIRSTQPPDPSLYLLEPDTPALYHFSLRLAYQRQLRPQASTSTSGSIGAKAATAFALTPDNRMVFMAFGNEVVYAGMP